MTRHQHLLLDLLSQILGRYSYTPIIEVSIENERVVMPVVEDKFVILDLHVTDEKQRKINIEMHVQRDRTDAQRMVYCGSKLLAKLTGRYFILTVPVFERPARQRGR